MATDHPSSSALGDAPFNAGGRRSARATSDWDEDFADAGDTHGRSLILASVARDARLDQKYLLLIVLSAAIATLGLLQSSTAVVIGAMLVSPLLGPIMGIGFGLATLESNLIKRSLVTLAAGMAVAIIIAMLISWISPIKDVTPELRARTQPTLLDLGVAVVGGIAGVYAIMRKLSGVMVGVAIAFAATIVARLNHFGPSLTRQHTLMQVAGIIVTLGILSIPLALSLNNIAREVSARSAVQAQLDALLSPSDRVDGLNVRIDGDEVVVDGVVLVDKYSSRLNSQLAASVRKRLDRNVKVSIVQLKQQSNAAVQLEERFNQRITALEQREQDGREIIAGITVGGLVPRDRVLVDAQARRVVVRRDREDEGEIVAAAIDRIIAEVQTDHPAWLILNGDLAPARAAEE